MNTGLGTLAQISMERAQQIEAATKPNSGIFKVGDQVLMKGSLFEIRSIGRRQIKLRLMKGMDLR